jgi:hypothetical protein
LNFPKSQLYYGAEHLAKMWDSMVASTFDILNPFIVNPLVFKGLSALAILFMVAALLIFHALRIVAASGTTRASPRPARVSKDQLEGKLYLTHRRSRTADGTEAIWSIAAVRISPSEEVVIGVAPIRVIRRIERLPAKLEHL